MIRTISLTLLIGVAVLVLGPASVCSARPMSLEGFWRFMLDPTDSGEKNLWFNQNLPGAYPDYEVIKKFTGYMRPSNYEIFRDSLKAHGLLERNKAFVSNSGRSQLIAYKEEIEANLRTPGLSGFQLLSLHDYLGQGTAFVGMLDAFWDPKWYITPEEFKQFSNTTVPLARFPKRVFTTAETLDVDVEIAHYGAEPIERAPGQCLARGGSQLVFRYGRHEKACRRRGSKWRISKRYRRW